MPFLDTSSVRLHYKFEPTRDRPVIVFSNSLGTDLSMWEAQAAAFRDRFSILRFDTRGHGRSSVPDDARFLLKHIPSATGLALPAAHLSNIDAPAAFNSGVLRFLNETYGRSHHG